MCRTRNSRLTRFFQSVVTCFGQCYFSITNCFTWVYYDTCIGRTVSNCLCYTGISICFCCCVQCFYAFQYLAEYLSRPIVKLFQPVIKFFRLLLLTRRYPTVVLDNIIMNQSSANLSPLEFKDIYLNFKGPEEMINAQVLIDWCTIEINRLQMKKHLNFKEVDRKFSQIQQVINIIDTNVSPVTEQCYLNPKEKKKTLQSYQKFLTFYHKAKPIILKKINKTSRIKSSFSPIVALILLISLPLCIICSIPLCLMKINLMYTIDVMTRNMEVNLPVSVGKNKPSCFIFCCSHCCPRDEDAHCDCYCMPLCSQNGTEMVEMSDLKCQDVPGFNETVFNNPYQSCDDKNLNLSCPPFDNPSFNASCQICDDKAFNTSYQASNVTTLTELNATTSNNTDISYRRCMCIELKDENNDKQLNDNEKKELQNIKKLLSIDKEDINKKENTMKTEKKP